MLIVCNGTTIMNVEKVISMVIKYTPEKEKVLKKTGFLGLFNKYDEIDVDKWTLEFKYICAAKKNQENTLTVTNSIRINVDKVAKEIIEQLKEANIVNQAFEDAFLRT